MDFWRTVQVLRRRWYVVGPALLVSAVITVGTFFSIPTRYESTGVLVLTSPSAGARFAEGTKPEDAVRINPLLAFDGSLTTTAQIVAQILRDPATAEALGAGKNSTNTYTVTNGELNGPFVFVVAECDTADSSAALVGSILGRASDELNTRQRALDAPQSTFIQAQLVVKPTEPAAKIGGKIRFGGAALVLSLILSLAAAFAAESIGQARARRLGLGGADSEPARSNPTRSGPDGSVPAPVATAGPAYTTGSNGVPAQRGLAHAQNVEPAGMNGPQFGTGPQPGAHDHGMPTSALAGQRQPVANRAAAPYSGDHGAPVQRRPRPRLDAPNGRALPPELRPHSHGRRDQ